MNTVLGIDLGTQGLKVVFLDVASGRIVASASAPLELRQAAGGVAEQEAGWWLAALKAALAEIDADTRSSAGAVSVSGQQHGFVALNNNDEVLAPVKLWCDTSTAAECDDIMAAVGGAARCIELAGNPILPGYTASKVRWLRTALPEAYQELDAILLPHDYLNLVLTGERAMEAGDASGTGFFDVRARRWSSELLAAIDPDRDLAECLPAVRVSNEPIGVVTDAAADAFGLPAGIPVATGGGDNMMGAIGTGNVRAGCMTMSLGTSGTVYAFADEPVVDPKGAIAAFCASTNGWLPLLCTMNCTVTTELMRGLLGADLAAFEQAIAGTEPGAGGVLTLPFFNGERTPNLPNARGGIVGLSGQNATTDNLLRSAVEGATFALRFGIDELKGLGVSAEEIVLTGGGMQSATWRQIVADVTATPVVVYEQEEGAALGAALQALHVLEPGSTIAEITDRVLTRDERRCSDPSDAVARQYESFYANYRQAVSAVTTLYH